MGNVTSDLIETAIQSANDDSDRLAHVTDPAKLELYRLLRERMADGDSDHKNVTSSAAYNKSSGDAADTAPLPTRETSMMAPKKKFLIGYRGGSEDEPASDQTDSSTNPAADAVKVSPTSPLTSAEVARSRSHTVSLPFRSRGPPQPEAPRRPLVEPKLVDAVSSAVTIKSCIVAAIDSRVGTLTGPCSQPLACSQPRACHIDTSVGRPRPHPVASEVLPPLEAVSREVRPSPGENIYVDKRLMPQQQQRTVPIVSVSGSSYSPRGNQHYSTGVLEPSGSGRQMIQHARERVTALPEPCSSMAEPTVRQISESHLLGARYNPPAVSHPGMDRLVDRRILPPSANECPPPQTMDRRFAIPPEYWKDVAADDWRKVGHQIPDRGEVRMTAVGHEAYAASRYADSRVTDRISQHYMLADTRPPDQATGRSADFPRGLAVQHLLTDSYQHVGGVELPSRENRTARSHYDMSQHARKYPSADYGVPVAASELLHDRRQPPEAIMVQTVGAQEAENPYHQVGQHAAPLQPVEPSVRPRIAGLTHGDPSTVAAYEPTLPTADPGKYSGGEHIYRSGRYDAADWSRPAPDALAPSDVKHARRYSPYHCASARSLSRTAGSLPSSGSSAVPRVTAESPLDLTVRKSMTAEAFLRRCHDPAHLSSQYTSPGRPTAELQYSGFPSSHGWTSGEGFEASRQTSTGGMFVPMAESSYPGFAGYRTGEVVQPGVHSVVRGYAGHHPESAYIARHRRDEEDISVVYGRRDVDPCCESARLPAASMTASPIIRPSYWDSRHATRPNTELSESAQQHGTGAGAYVGDVVWMGSHYDARHGKSGDALEPTSMGLDRRPHGGAELPVAVSPQSVPVSTTNRRIPMVQLLGGKYSPSDILYLCCKVCGSKYGSLRSFRMHFAKVHGQEPTPENFTIQTISDARSQAMSQRARASADDLPPTLTMESSSRMEPSSEVAASEVEQHKRGVGEFAAAVTAKPRSVAEVQPMQKKASPPPPPGPTSVDQRPPTPASGKPSPAKPSPAAEATKRTGGEDGRTRCRRCGGLARDVRQHERSVHGADWSGAAGTCSCEAADPDAGCAVCLEGFNDVSDWQRHVTSQHMMRSCVCKSCDVGFTNASALRRHLAASHAGTPAAAASVEVHFPRVSELLGRITRIRCSLVGLSVCWSQTVTTLHSSV